MMLSPRAIALQGVGSAAAVLAVVGFASAASDQVIVIESLQSTVVAESRHFAMSSMPSFAIELRGSQFGTHLCRSPILTTTPESEESSLPPLVGSKRLMVGPATSFASAPLSESRTYGLAGASANSDACSASVDSHVCLVARLVSTPARASDTSSPVAHRLLAVLLDDDAE